MHTYTHTGAHAATRNSPQRVVHRRVQQIVVFAVVVTAAIATVLCASRLVLTVASRRSRAGLRARRGRRRAQTREATRRGARSCVESAQRVSWETLQCARHVVQM